MSIAGEISTGSWEVFAAGDAAAVVVSPGKRKLETLRSHPRYVCLGKLGSMSGLGAFVAGY